MVQYHISLSRAVSPVNKRKVRVELSRVLFCLNIVVVTRVIIGTRL